MQQPGIRYSADRHTEHQETLAEENPRNGFAHECVRRKNGFSGRVPERKLARRSIDLIVPGRNDGSLVGWIVSVLEIFVFDGSRGKRNKHVRAMIRGSNRGSHLPDRSRWDLTTTRAMAWRGLGGILPRQWIPADLFQHAYCRLDIGLSVFRVVEGISRPIWQAVQRDSRVMQHLWVQPVKHIVATACETVLGHQHAGQHDNREDQ